MAKSAALGKGLSSLLGSSSPLVVPEPVKERGESVRQISRTEIVPSPFQPRKTFRPEQLTDLTESIRERGVVQPLIVRRRDNRYEIIAGARRWRAAGEAGLELVPVIVREASDRDVLELALIENIQRADLNPIEEAQAYARLMEDFSLTQEQVSQKVGKGRVVVANAVRLLSLPPAVRSWVEGGEISVGHAKVLLGLSGGEEQLHAAERIRKENLTVRGAERLVEGMRLGSGRAPLQQRAGAKGPPPSPFHYLRDLENRLQHHTGTRAKLAGTSEKGRLELYYFTSAELERILNLLHLPSS